MTADISGMNDKMQNQGVIIKPRTNKTKNSNNKEYIIFLFIMFFSLFINNYNYRRVEDATPYAR